MRNFLKEGLRRLVNTDTKRAVGSRSARVLAVSAQKGGVGKTTTSVNLAAALARYHGLKTLLVDLDPQGHVEAAIQSLVKQGGSSLSSVFEDSPTRPELMDTAANTSIVDLDVCVADKALEDTDALLNSRIGKEFVLKEAIELTRTYYDVIVLDCPPNVGNLTLNALVAADDVLIPCDPSPLATQGVEGLFRTLGTISARLNPTIDVAGILVTRYDGRNASLNEAALAKLRDSFGDAVLPLHIGVNTNLVKAQQSGQDVFAFAPRSRGAQHYRELADLYAARVAEASKARAS